MNVCLAKYDETNNIVIIVIFFCQIHVTYFAFTYTALKSAFILHVCMCVHNNVQIDMKGSRKMISTKL